MAEHKEMYLKVLATVTEMNNFDPDFLVKAQSLFENSSIEKYPNYVVVYNHYESDYKGDYDMSIAIISDQSDYDIKLDELTLFNHDSNLSVLQIWQKIWSKEDAGKLKRLYQTDIEVHTGNRTDVYLQLA